MKFRILEEPKRQTLAVRQYPQLPDRELWIFAYGSLMWHPGFSFIEAQTGKIFGFRRDLCLRSVVHRGTHESPGLVFGLACGGSCVGKAYRIDNGDRENVLRYLWRREMVRNTYIPTLVRIHLSRGTCTGLTFVVDSTHSQYTSNLSDTETAEIIAGSHGISGPNTEYFLHSLKKFKEVGIPTDRYENIHRLIEE